MPADGCGRGMGDIERRRVVVVRVGESLGFIVNGALG